MEAVGIGKDKADLTRFTAEPPKSNPSFSFHPCAPTGKAWSSLEPCDIIKYLTGGFRLSKAKSNDLFWEAVWPRLLARGWHSEQPNNNPGFVSSRDYLVFLMPGVKKFSRRKLVKGDHYFDSVSDVLHKVIIEPNLLELEFQEAKVESCNEEDGWIMERASDKDDQSDCHHRLYLKPRVSSFKTDQMKFTVVDTSLKHGGKSSDLRELRSLPLGFKITSQQTSQVRGKESDLSGNVGGEIEIKAGGKSDKVDKQSNEVNNKKGMTDSIRPKLTKFTVVDTSSVHCGKSSRELRCKPVEMKIASKKMNALSREVDGSLSDHFPGVKETTVPLDDKNNSSSVNCQRDTSDGESINRKGAHDRIDKNNSKNNNALKLGEGRKSQKNSVFDDRQLEKTIKQLSRKAKYGHSTNIATPIKRRRLSACAKAETSRIPEISSEDSKSENLGLSQLSSLPEDSQKTTCSTTFSVGVGREDNKGSILNKDCLDTRMSCGTVEKCGSQPQINLNLHQLPPKSENGEMMEEDEKCLKSNDANNATDAQKQLLKPVEQKTDVNPRRQSTRNRPLTVRALESIEIELMYVQKKLKKKEVQTPKASFSPCRRARTRVKKHSHNSSGGSCVGSGQEKHLNGDIDVNQDINKEPH